MKLELHVWGDGLWIAFDGDAHPPTPLAKGTWERRPGGSVRVYADRAEVATKDDLLIGVGHLVNALYPARSESPAPGDERETGDRNASDDPEPR